MKKNRILSFIVIIAVYILAAFAGIVVYKALPYAWWLNLLIADIAAIVVTFFFSLILGNAFAVVVSIPMADHRMSQRQGFDEYKRQTRMLLPIKK